jgi:hypothetical protein
MGLLVGAVGLIGLLVSGLATSVAEAATGSSFSTTVSDPVGVAATPTALYVSTFGGANLDCNTIYSISTGGVPTAYADLAQGGLAPCDSDEIYLAVTPAPFGSFATGTLFAADGPNIYDITPGGCGASSSCVHLFATLPTLPDATAAGGSHTGLTFDPGTSFGGDLIAVGENASNGGDVYVIPPSGTASLLVSIPANQANEGLEAPSVLPAQWGPYAGDLLTVSDQSSDAFIITPGGTFSVITGLTGAEASAVVPASPCNYGGSSYFASMFGVNVVEGYAPSQLSGLAGDVLVNTEGTNDGPPFPGVLELVPTGTSTLPTVFPVFDNSAAAAVQQEGGSIANCPTNNTSLTTSLSGGGQSGATITVPSGTAVTDQATLHGATAGATGTVTYGVFTDNLCKNPLSGATPGTSPVSGGVVTSPSNPVTLTATGSSPTLYYWQASYSGDTSTGDQPSVSTCTAEVATVTPPQTGNGSTFTPGYFKNNHAGITCATWGSIPEPALGNYTIQSCADALAILGETGCGHQDGLVKCTAEQVLVAELNTNKGGSFGGPSSACIVTAPNGINAANALLKNDVGPSGYAGPNGTYTITNGATAAFQAAQTTLSAYNQDRNSTSSSTC